MAKQWAVKTYFLIQSTVNAQAVDLNEAQQITNLELA